MEQNNDLTLSYLYYFPNKFFLVILLVLNRDNNTEFIKKYFNIVIIIRLLLRNLIKNIQKHEKMYLHKTTLDLSEVVMGFAKKNYRVIFNDRTWKKYIFVPNFFLVFRPKMIKNDGGTWKQQF